MPYIKQENRGIFETAINSIPLMEVGGLNYLITNCCIKYLEQHPQSYKTYNDIIGVLECAKLEFYRRRIAQYEDKKIVENGDV
jgi:hypothetical protein